VPFDANRLPIDEPRSDKENTKPDTKLFGALPIAVARVPELPIPQARIPLLSGVLRCCYPARKQDRRVAAIKGAHRVGNMVGQATRRLQTGRGFGVEQVESLWHRRIATDEVQLEAAGSWA